MPFHLSDPPIYRLLRVRQVGLRFLAAEDGSAVEVPVLLMLKLYSWPAKRYVVELSAGTESIGLQYESTKRDAMPAFRELRKRKELWLDPLRPELAQMRRGTGRPRAPR